MHENVISERLQQLGEVDLLQAMNEAADNAQCATNKLVAIEEAISMLEKDAYGINPKAIDGLANMLLEIVESWQALLSIL